MRSTQTRRRRIAALASLVGLAVLGVAALSSAAPTGPEPTIFTTNSDCSGVNFNVQYESKDDVYVNGGPKGNGPGLTDGSYYVMVTSPEGTVLGKSDTPTVTVTGGAFAECYQLSAIVNSASSGFLDPGYDDTDNAGGEYKVWVSSVSTFDNSDTKTDNFKVRSDECTENCGPQGVAQIDVDKYYDADADGTHDAGESAIAGWQFAIHDGITETNYTPQTYIVQAPDTYTITESDPLESNWFHTGSTITGTTATSQTNTEVVFDILDGDGISVDFGNVCVGAGGGMTIGFWSNKNGQALIDSADLAALVALNLRNANGTAFDPANKTAYKNWLLSATATNMAYMLSAQLSAMKLNVLNNKVDGTDLIYAPGTTSANSNGFASVNDVMAEANTELGLHGLVLSDSPSRTYQEALKNALDKANNNLNFVQDSPCAFSFAA